jgi:hypothetical protein
MRKQSALRSGTIWAIRKIKKKKEERKRRRDEQWAIGVTGGAEGAPR